MTTRRFDLPDGSYAMIKDQADLTRGDRKVLRRAQNACRSVRQKFKDMGLVPPDEADDAAKAAFREKLRDPRTQEAIADALTPEESEANDDLQAAMIVAYVDSWSGGKKPSMDNLDYMNGEVFDALAAEVAGFSFEAEEDFDPTPAGVDSPTEPSAT